MSARQPSAGKSARKSSGRRGIPAWSRSRRARLAIVLAAALLAAMAERGSTESGPEMPPPEIDHLLYACPDLERGMDEIESLLGVRPFPGGRHSRYGTHNALVSLGKGVYLEVIARDPELEAPERGALVEVEGPCRLLTWAAGTAHIESTAAAAQQAGIGLGSVEEGSRERPDGSLLRWRLTDPYAMPLGGAVPFLIDWGDTTHPSTVAPRAGELIRLEIGHPAPGEVRRALAALSIEIDVVEEQETRLSATISTSNGPVALR